MTIQTISPPSYRRRGRSWTIDFSYTTDGQRARIRKQCRTRGDAESFYRQVAREVMEGVFRQAPARRVTLAEMAEEFTTIGAAGKRPHSVFADKKAVADLLEQIPGDTPLDEITTKDIDAFRRRLEGRNLSESTVHGRLTVIRRLFRLAVRWKYLSSTDDPTEGMRKPVIPEGDVVFLELHDQRRLVAAARSVGSDERHNAQNDAPYIAPLVIVALHTGMRLGELRHLQWDHVDLERRQVMVKNTPHFRTKTKKNRLIGLSADAVAALQEWKAWFGREIARARERAVDRRLTKKLRADADARLDMLIRRSPAPGRLVFPSFKLLDDKGDGAPLNNITRSWTRTRKEAFGVKGDDGRVRVPLQYRIGIHALRHTFAVTLARKGVPLVKIKEAMGHKSIRTTEIYLRFYPDEGRDLADKMDSLEGGAVTPVSQTEKASQVRNAQFR